MRYAASLFLVALSLLLLPTAHAEILCAQTRNRPKVVNGRVTVRLSSLFSTTAATCPTGSSAIFSTTSGEYLTGGTLTAGETLVGVFTAAGSGEANLAADSISFQKPLASEPSVEVVRIGSTGTNCTGTLTAPTAPQGYLCIYEGYTSNVVSGAGGYGVYPAQTGGSGRSASRHGAGIYIYRGASASTFSVMGTWAVTGN